MDGQAGGRVARGLGAPRLPDAARQQSAACAAGITLILALCAAPTPARAQRDVGPVRVALFAGVRVAGGGEPLVGLAGELELHQVWTLAAAASYVSVTGGSYTRYEVDGRWRPAREGAVRPYLGAGLAVTRSSVASVGGPTRTRYGGLAIAGVEVPVFGTTFFAEVVGVETGSLTAEVRGGLRLLVIGP
jgi:hypothetical protein